jgi:putative thioredoxin
MTSGASDAERAWAVDVDETNFEAAVIEESGKIPVIVDFWAEWCGPCRALEPVLEKVARRYAGSIVVARANVDRVQRLAATLQIRSIPTLLAFRDGKAVEEIVGVVPEPELREFVERLLPTGADLMVREARSIEDEEPGRA